ncbi:uncharacterized protein LOC112563179 isoform X2 [Pomacea canaliculata]|uniref:uncharacterized protein LOC112563179 isoform X2 n=1 Tax=Pomacea canaliculata TaxID=400727 RepID=UPI000D7377A6|nr:uncharacterized protein LOC112563179 isoform X2 [Pomacea canaliculata]XP_025092748.1 uncharacterized protein LOC112563179 isoform X2 [Pomacea canaliculata]
MTAILTTLWVTAVAVVVAVVVAEDCLTDDNCRNITATRTTGNVTYCCSDVSRQMSVRVDGQCQCLSQGLHNGTGQTKDALKNWADDTMDEGRMCLFGEKDCSGSHFNATIGSVQQPYCCRNSDNIEFVMYNASDPDYVGCRCANNSAPLTPPGAYNVPLTQRYVSSGEACLYEALCDDNPSLKCEGHRGVYCCYNSRGIHTTNLNATTTACTCSNEFRGERCDDDVKSVPALEQRCLKDAACPVGAKTAVVKSGAQNVTVTYCCPSLIHEPHVQTVQGATPKDICSCSSHDEEGSPTVKTIQWAELTKDYGRWCESGSACELLSSKLTFYRNYDTSTNKVLSLCCRTPNTTYYFAAYEQESYESIGCRCANTRVPHPEHGAYAVPEAGFYNSTGEACSYNSGCDDHPSLKCEASDVSFCCYGSRGMYTDTLNDRITSCTCTNDRLGEFCAGKLFPVSTSSHVTPSGVLCLLLMALYCLGR